LAEVKICLSARRAPIVLPPGHERPWQGRNSFLVRRVAVNREVSVSPVLFLANAVWITCGCNAVGCANTNDHRPTNTRSFFSAPEAVLNEVELYRYTSIQIYS